MRFPHRIRYIDGWRAIAVIIVMGSHLSQNLAIKAYMTSIGLDIFFRNGEVGVLIFFFISGFVVSKSSFSEIQRTNSFSVNAFYVRRVFRIVPPLLVYLLTLLLLGSCGIIKFTSSNMLSAALYLCNVNIGFARCPWYGGHTWSLAFEEQFYLIFPVAFSFITLSRKPSLPFLSVAVAIGLFPFFYPLHWIGRSGFVLIYCLFALGYISAKHSDRVLKCVGRNGTVFFIASSFLIFEVPLIAASNSTIDQFLFFKYYKMIFILAIPLLVLSASADGSVANRLLRSKLLSYLGRASYSIYLWQQLFTSPYFNGLSPARQLAAMSLMIGGCIISYQYFEKKMISTGMELSEQIKSRARTAN